MVHKGFRIEHKDKVARLILDRPEKHNAFGDALIADLTGALESLDKDPSIRIVVLAAEGPSFSAGGDLAWMQRAAKYDATQNLADAQALAKLMATLDGMSKPTIAAVQGPAYGGGCGLIAACDIAIATTAAIFALTEVRLGLIPAVIGPYVIRAIGQRQARRLFLTAERFSAEEALRIGFIHEVTMVNDLQNAVNKVTNFLIQGGPKALGEAKKLIQELAGSEGQNSTDAMAKKIAEMRQTPEGREGVAAFLEKRKPAWVIDDKNK
jgi:methylglutaconyl-CoA hydratase